MWNKSEEAYAKKQLIQPVSDLQKKQKESERAKNMKPPVHFTNNDF